MRPENKYFPLIIIALALLPFIFLQFHSNQFFLTHDGPFHIERTFNYVNALREGNFPPGWTRLYNSDFGSPIFLYLFPIPYWISSGLFLAGIDLVSVLKLDFLFWQLVMVSGMYFWLRRGMAFSREAALVGGILYLYSPINIAQVFVRGSLRELAGTAIFPLVLYFLGRLRGNLDRRSLGISALVVSIFLLTDGLTALTFTPVLLVYLVYLLYLSKNRLTLFKNMVIVFTIGVLTASFIYLPFLLEAKFLKGGVSIFVDHLVYWWQFFDPHWGFGFSEPGPKDSISFQIGLANLLAFAVFIFLVFRKKIAPAPLQKLFLVCLAIYFLLMAHGPVSLFLGRAVSFLSLVQFPWRFLIPTVFIFSFLAGSVAEKLKPSKKIVLVVLFLVIAISFRYLRTNQTVVYGQTYLANNAGDATAYHEFIPVWRDKTSEFSGFPNKTEIIQGQGAISDLVEKNSSLNFRTDSPEQLIVRINTLYYPGWKAFIDGKRTPTTTTANLSKSFFEKRDLSGLMSINIPSGNHVISLRFEDTQIRSLGKIFSLLGVLAIAVLLI